MLREKFRNFSLIMRLYPLASVLRTEVLCIRTFVVDDHVRSLLMITFIVDD